MMKKVLALALAALMLFAFAACGKPAQDPANDGSNTGSAKTTLTMGTNAAFAPYEFVDDSGKIVGIDAEIAEAIADKLGMKLEIKDMAFDSLITAVSSGSIDMVLAGMTVTEERKQSVNFTDSYAKGVQSIIVPEGSAIASADDLKNAKKIGVQSGTTGDTYCSDDFGEDKVSKFDNGAVAVQALANGQVDCVVIDNEPAKQFVKQNSGLKILDTAYTEEDYAAAVAKDNTELLEKLNGAIAELKAEGKIDEIVGKYIKAE